MSIWEILGIQPTNDEAVIRKAYLAKLPNHHPEDDPEGFRRLREAMEQATRDARAACRQAKNDSSPVSAAMMGSGPVQELVKEAEELYRDCHRRFSPGAWKSLLSLPVCQELDEQKEAGLALLGFLMDHPHFPHSCYQVLNQHFGWTDEEDMLYRHFPKNYVDYLLDRIRYEDALRYDLFPEREDFDYDSFCRTYFALRRAVGEGNQKAADEALETLEATGMEHPDLTLLKIRHLLKQDGRLPEAWELAKTLYVQDGGHIPTRQMYVRLALEYEDSQVDSEVLDKLISSLLDNDPKSPAAWQLLGDHLRRQGRLSPALSAYQRAKRCADRDWNYLDQQIKETADALSQQMEADSEFDDPWHFANVCWAAQRYDQVCRTLENFTPNEEQTMSWLFLMGGSCHQLGDYQRAAEFRQQIWDATPPQDRGYSLYLDLAEDYERLGNTAQAEAIYQQGQQAFPGAPELLYRYARLLYNDDRYDEALVRCEEALAGGFYRDAFLLRIEILLEQEQYEEVRDDAEDIMKRGFQSAQLLLFYARALRKLEDYQKAEDVLKDLNQRTGGSHVICEEYAILCGQDNRPGEALEWIDRALAKQDTPIRHYRRAEYLHDLERYEEELAEYRLLAEQGLSGDYLDYRIGKALYSMKRYGEAEQRFRASTAANPTLGYTWDYLGDALQCQGKWQDAAEAYEKGWKLGHRQSIRDLCRLMKRTQQYDRAVELLEQGLKRFPDDTSLLWIYANTLRRMKRTEDAVRCLGRYMEVKPKDTSSALRETALLWVDVKDYETAKIWYQKAIDHEPDNGKNWRSLGKFYAVTCKLPETALPYLEKAAELEPDAGYGWLLLGHVYKELGDEAKAVQCYQSSLEAYEKKLKKDPDDCCILEGIAEVLVFLGRLDEAEEMAGRAIALQNSVFGCASTTCYEALEDFAKAAERRGDLDTALHYMEQAGQKASFTDFYPDEIARLKQAIADAQGAEA